MENKSILYICISIIIGFSILSISLLLNKETNEDPTEGSKESFNLKK